MAQEILNNNELKASFRKKLNNNFSDLYEEKHSHSNLDVLNKLDEQDVNKITQVVDALTIKRI